MTQCGAKLAIRLTNDRGDVVATDFRCMFEREQHAADPILDHCYTLRWAVSDEDHDLLRLDPDLHRP